MFRCKECGSTEFNLVINPNYDGVVEVTTNQHDEVVVSAGSQSFVADLMFMNQFAVCNQCTGIKKWEYFFPRPLSNAS